MVYLLRKITGNRLPKWLVSAAAGLAMLTYLAYYDYTWYDFKRSQLPVDTKLIAEQRATSFLKPWSYVVTPVSAFTIFDGRSQTSEQNGQLLVEYILYTFHKDPIEQLTTQAYLLNCNLLERAVLAKEENAQQITVKKIERNDPMYQQLCL